MTTKELDKLMQMVSDAYGCDDIVMSYYRDPEGDYGDGMARFIAQEIRELAEGDESISNVIRGIDNAVGQLESVRQALENVA